MMYTRALSVLNLAHGRQAPPISDLLYISRVNLYLGFNHIVFSNFVALVEPALSSQKPEHRA